MRKILKEYWPFIVLFLVCGSIAVQWWQSLDFSYGSYDCAYPIILCWLLVVGLALAIMVDLSRGGD